MIEVVVSENGRIVDRLEFDADNVTEHNDGIASVHHGVMRHCSRPALWYRVAHAAGWVAETGSALRALKELEDREPAPGKRPSRSRGTSRPTVSIERLLEIEDDDLYRLQRDKGESEADYLGRCEMLGCDRKGFIRLPRRA